MSDTYEFELFHAIGDGSSARVRRFVVEHELERQVRFRNVTYPEVLADLMAHTPSASTPALWDGQSLFVGADASIQRLRAWLNLRD